MRSAALVALLALASGCMSPGSGGSGDYLVPPSPPVTLAVPTGEWLAFYPGGVPGPHGAYHLQFNRVVEYAGPGLNTQDSYDCSVAAIGGQWLEGDTSFRAFGGMYEGTRDNTGDHWLNVRMGEGGATPGYAAGGDAGGPEDLVLAANAQVGNAASNLTIDSEGGARVAMHGRYWCLDGPSMWEGGTYKASSMSLNASGLEWHLNAEKGLLVRVETALSGDLALDLQAPDGTTIPLPEGRDLTFCSEQVGPWAFTMSTRVHDFGAVRLTISILDAAGTGFECQGGWRVAPYFGSAATLAAPGDPA
jgi:hypothetical protein